MIDCELDIIDMELKYPGCFNSDTSCVPLAKWNGTIAALLELALCLQKAGIITKLTGEGMAWSDMIRHIGRVFGVIIPRPYERKDKLFTRKKDETPFLHKLIDIFRIESEDFFNK